MSRLRPLAPLVVVLAAAVSGACAPAATSSTVATSSAVVVVPPPEASAAAPPIPRGRAVSSAPPPVADAAPPSVFAVDVSAGGELRVAGARVSSDDELLALARGAAAQHADARAVIRADRAVLYGRVVHVLDLLKQAGLTRIAFGVAAAP